MLRYVDVIFLWWGHCSCSKPSCRSRCQGGSYADRLCVSWDVVGSSPKALVRLLPFPLIFILSPDLTPDDPIPQEDLLWDLGGYWNCLGSAGFLLCRYLSKRLMFVCFQKDVAEPPGHFLRRRKENMVKRCEEYDASVCWLSSWWKLLCNHLLLFLARGLVKKPLDFWPDWPMCSRSQMFHLFGSSIQNESVQWT